MIDLKLSQILDTYIRSAFTTLRDSINRTGLSGSNMRFMEIETKGAVTNHVTPHLLGFIPSDIIVTAVRGTGVVTWNYDKFTSTDLHFSTSGAIKIRCLVGKIR